MWAARRRGRIFSSTPFETDALGDCIRLIESDRRYPLYREIEFIPWGGAYGRGDESACFHHRAPRMLIRHTSFTGAFATDDLRADARIWADASYGNFAPCANGHVYQGYADLHLEDWAHAYYGDAYPRLQEIKRLYDPDGVFAHAQSIRPEVIRVARRVLYCLNLHSTRDGRHEACYWA